MANPLKLLKLKAAGFQFIQELKVDAPPSRVWKTVLDMPGWFRFNPTDKRHGRVEPWVGGRFYAENPDGSSSLYMTITRIEPNKLLRAMGPMGMSHLPVNNAFIFELQPRGKNGTLLRFCQRTFGFITPEVQKDYAGGWKQLLPQIKRMSEKKKR